MVLSTNPPHESVRNGRGFLDHSHVQLDGLGDHQMYMPGAATSRIRSCCTTDNRYDAGVCISTSFASGLELQFRGKALCRDK